MQCNYPLEIKKLLFHGRRDTVDGQEAHHLPVLHLCGTCIFDIKLSVVIDSTLKCCLGIINLVKSLWMGKTGTQGGTIASLNVCVTKLIF